AKANIVERREASPWLPPPACLLPLAIVREASP
ncbi:MAG: hypothetical protein RL684_1014, partial [Pseudomonadota bacterium]